MRVLACPTGYAAYLESTIVATLAEVKRDIERRADEDPRVRALATVPPQFIDATDTADTVIVIGTPSDDSDWVALFGEAPEDDGDPPEPDMNADNYDRGEYTRREALHDAGR